MSGNPRQSLISVKDLQVFFPVASEKLFDKEKKFVKAVNHVSLEIYKGETLGVVGESGCGKTTFGKSILQLVKPTGGEVWYHGADGDKELRTLPAKEMKALRGKLQIVFQDPYSSLNPSFTIYQSMSDPLATFGVKTENERRKIIGDLLESVNLRREYMDRYPNEFSGGQRQRIGIARALSIQPEMIVCDECVSALDVSVQAQVLQLLAKLKRERGLTYIFITHDLSVVEYIADRIAVMYLGKLVELSDADSLYAKTLHPYTQALLSAIPVADIDNKKKRILLDGDVPSPINLPKGCAFQGRCKFCRQKCREIEPELKRYEIDGSEHFAACHKVEEEFADNQIES